MDTAGIIHKRYTRIEKIGEGGMATVFRAFDTQLERDVAVKVILPEFAGRPNFRSRFEREVKALAKLQHPNIVPVYDFFSAAKGSYYVMALLDGESLRDIMKSRAVEPRLVKSVMAGMLSALQYAHGKDIIHRDVKPDNIVVDRQGQVYLTDFGIVHMEDQDITQLTRAGMFLGTPQYASPEQIEGRELTPASDIYSLGAMLYELLAGKVPFTGSMNAVISGHLTKDVPPIDPSHVAAPLRPLVPIAMKMLAKDPAARYSSCREIAAAMQNESAPPAAREESRRPVEPPAEESGSRDTDTLAVGRRGAGGEHEAPVAAALPVLKKRLRDTERHLANLEKNRDGVSDELYLERKRSYENDIASLRAEIVKAESLSASRARALESDRSSLEENLVRCEREMGELDHLESRGAIPSADYKRKKADLKKSARRARDGIAAIDAELQKLKKTGDGAAPVSGGLPAGPSGEKRGIFAKAVRIVLALAAAAGTVYGGIQLFQWITRSPGVATADRAPIYSSHSWDAEVVGSLRAGDAVDIYTTHVTRGQKEVITLRPTTMRSGSGTRLVPWRTMLRVQGENRDQYFAAFRYAPGTVYQGYIPKSDVKSMKGTTWYKIRARNGTTGWVFSMYVKKRPRPDRAAKKDNRAADEETGDASGAPGPAVRLKPESVSASSVLSSEDGQFGAYLTIDGNPNTAWIEGPKDETQGPTWLRYEFGDPVKIRSFKIINGYPLKNAESGDQYPRYGRVIAAKLKFDDGEESVSLRDDARDFQEVTLQKEHSTKTVEVIVTAVSAGSEFPSCGVAEVEFHGRGPAR